MVLLLSQQDIGQVLEMRDVIQAITQAHIALARQEVVMPVRLTMRYDDRISELEAMPAFIRSTPALGMKVIDFVGTNSQLGLPAIHALIIVLDPDTGRPLAIMDGAHITAMRTAAASALATDLLARRESSSLAIIGTGVQARSHLAAMLEVRDIREVRVRGRRTERVTAFVDQSRCCYPDLEITASQSVMHAVKGVDIIVTATTSPSPILHWNWIKPGAHINAIGSHSPDTRELATDVVVYTRRFVDSREAILKECGDFLIAIAEGALTEDDIETEIGAVAAGIAPGRTSSDDVTLYKSGGVALQDVSTAYLAYQRAVERGIGQTFTFAEA